jgi:hypothetical protein
MIYLPVKDHSVLFRSSMFSLYRMASAFEFAYENRVSNKEAMGNQKMKAYSKMSKKFCS